MPVSLFTDTILSGDKCALSRAKIKRDALDKRRQRMGAQYFEALPSGMMERRIGTAAT
ncbi:MAG: hypothetical protein ISN28_15850 [Ectothiorhodospiraceae bacterium AqS1]|nr:hypothetical protein [Ectothiorhodospiraceae bacterium AqS1]